MAFKAEGKEMYLIFVFAKYCWSAHSCNAWQVEKPFPHKLCSFMSSLCACPASSPSLECIFSTYDLVWSKIRRSLDAEKAEKSVKLY